LTCERIVIDKVFGVRDDRAPASPGVSTSYEPGDTVSPLTGSAGPCRRPWRLLDHLGISLGHGCCAQVRASPVAFSSLAFLRSTGEQSGHWVWAHPWAQIVHGGLALTDTGQQQRLL